MKVLRDEGGWRLAIFAGLVLLVGLVAVSPVGAVETRGGEEVVVGPDEVIEDDLYVTANEILVEGTIEGDLVAFGDAITVDGTVEGDLISAGRSVEIGGTVEDDARIAGQALLLGGDALVGDDLIAAGYSLESEPESTVGGTLLYAGYQALLDGNVDEDLRVTANALQLGGEIGGEVDAEVDGEEAPAPPMFGSPTQVQMPTVESGLTLTDSARVGGDLTYGSNTEAEVSPGAQIEGETVREERAVEEEEPARNPVAGAVLDGLRSLVALALVGLLLVWLAPGWTRRLADTVRARPLPGLGWGILGFIAFIALAIAVVLATVLLAVIFGLLTLGGLVLLIVSLGVLAEALLVLAFLVSTNYLAQIVVALAVGRLLLERIVPNRAAGLVLPLLTGLVLYVVLRLVPVLGPIVGLAVVLLGLGALSGWVWTSFRQRLGRRQSR